MHAVEIQPNLKRPRTMRTLGHAIASITFHWSCEPRKLRNKHHSFVYKLRTTAFAVGKILGQEWAEIPLHRLVGLESELIRYALAEGIKPTHASHYAGGCRIILAHARASGWTCDAMELLESWGPVKEALRKVNALGCFQIINDFIVRGKRPAQTSEDDLESWRKRATDGGL